MNALSRIQCCLAAFAIHAAALLSHATAGDAPVTVKVRLDRDSYLPGEPILLLLDFQYHGDKVCYRNPDEAQRQEMANLDGGTEHDLTAVLKGPGGYVRTWRPRYRRYEPLGWTNPSFPTWAHERTRQTIILSRVFQPSAPGDYQLDWSLNVLIEEFARPIRG